MESLSCDDLNRYVQIKQYLRESELEIVDGNKQTSPFVTSFEYDKVGNMVKVIDAEGHVTFAEYDALNRKTAIYYPDGDKKTDDYYQTDPHLEIEYNLAENKRTIIDPSGRITEEIKDWNGNVIEVAKYQDRYQKVRYSSQATYDRLGNQVGVVDGKGQEYSFIYDELGRQIAKKLPETDTILPGTDSPITYRPTIKYEYDDLGRKTAEINPNGNSVVDSNERVDFIYDSAGRQIKTIVNKDGVNLITKKYYDRKGNLIRTVDPANREVKKVYHPRGWVLAEVDPLGRIAYHQYDHLGKETAVTDPRGVVKSADSDLTDVEEVEILDVSYNLDPTYTTTTEYDSLSRKIKVTDIVGNITETAYDKVGNKLMEKTTPGPAFSDDEPRVTRYTYTPQYWVESVINGSGNLTQEIKYEYDDAGNKIKEILPDVAGQPLGSNVISYEYDGIGRLVKRTGADGSFEKYEYDAIGNKTAVTNGRGFTTRYLYNGLNKLKEVVEPTESRTRYLYDPNGNLVQKIMANGMTTNYQYNDLNQLEAELKVRAGDLMERRYAYDKLGNMTAMLDPRGNLTATSYYPDGQVKDTFYYKQDTTYSGMPDLSKVTTDTENPPLGYQIDEKVSYSYDLLGNPVEIVDGPGRHSFTYDRRGQIISETREIDGESYTTEYQYDFVGNRTKVKYPRSSDWFEYEYNALDQLTGLRQLSLDANNNYYQKNRLLSDIDYDQAGNLLSMEYGNQVTTTVIPDVTGRPGEISVDYGDNNLMSLNYAYDENNNVVRRNDNNYTYDELDRLKTADIEGTIIVDRPGRKGYVDEDYFVNGQLDYEVEDKEVYFDYAASTLGIRFQYLQDIGRIELLPNERLNHRVNKDSIRLYYRKYLAQDFVEVPESDWVYDVDGSGKVIITLNKFIEAGEIKIHSNFDDRDIATGEIVNKSEFHNNLKDMIKVFGRYDQTEISYDYDAVGNRISETYNDPNYDYQVTYTYDYYANSNRLKTRESQPEMNLVPSNESYNDGILRVGPSERKAYRYDQAGNMVEKGTDYNVNGESINYNSRSGPGVSYWKYDYNARNRLSEVYKNGDSESDKIASYEYDYSGKRVKVTEGEQVTYYVYNYQGKVIFEDHIGKKREVSYIYAFGKVIAKKEKKEVKEGDKLTEVEEIYYYHHDNLGSTMAITDEEGQLVYQQDYVPFGRDIYKPGTLKKPDYDVEARMKFTGQIEDVNTGLYYYNARYYDPEIGRFTMEDSYQGELNNPQTLNLYIYTLNNPLKYTDPTGNKTWMVHGTYSSPKTFSYDFIEEIRWLFNEKKDSITKKGDKLKYIERFQWSGDNDDSARRRAANELKTQILKWHKEHPDDKIRIVGHSHGGKVGIIAANLLGLEGVKVNNLLTISTPVREYRLNQDNVKYHNHVYNKEDGTQVIGGNTFSYDFREFVKNNSEEANFFKNPIKYIKHKMAEPLSQLDEQYLHGDGGIITRRDFPDANNIECTSNYKWKLFNIDNLLNNAHGYAYQSLIAFDLWSTKMKRDPIDKQRSIRSR